MERKLLKRKAKALTKADKDALIKASRALANYYYRENNYDNALGEYSFLASLCDEAEDTLLYGTTNRMLGETCTELGRYEEAVKHNQIFLDTVRAAGDKLEEVRAFISIGRTFLTQVMSNPKHIDLKALTMAEQNFFKGLAISSRLTGISRLEHRDIEARLVLNIALVKEYSGKLNEAIDYIQKSIELSVANDMFDLVHQGHFALALMYGKKQEFAAAVTSLNSAIDAAERLKDNEKLASALVHKAEMLTHLGEFHDARQVYLKAYKMKELDDRAMVVHNLKVVAAMCQVEDELIAVEDTDYNTRKDMYEKMADGCTALKCFDRAITYYHKTLECQQKLGDSARDMQSTFFSLARTYADVKQYDNALEYFNKEYETTKCNPEESYFTLKNMAQVLVKLEADVADVTAKFEEALHDVRQLGNEQYEADVLVAYMKALEKYGNNEEAATIQRQLRQMTYEEPETDSDEIDTSTTNIGDDINIDDIPDLSDKENENSSPQRGNHCLRRRTRRHNYRTNAKGETPLHKACIKNNMELAKQLVQQGHPVNIADFCGWMPLHEACNYGNLEMVEFLLDNNAQIEAKCTGVTPLLDAAVNGHLDVMQVLLRRGASALAVNSEGQTVVDCLKEYYAKADKGTVDEVLYNSILEQVTRLLEKAGRSVTGKGSSACHDHQHSASSPAPPFILEVEATNPRTRRSSNLAPKKVAQPCCSYGKNGHRSSSPTERVYIPSPTFDPSDSESELSDGTSAQREYKQVMENLRKRPAANRPMSPATRPDLPAFISAEQANTDWLDDDLAINQAAKKRKMSGDTHMRHIFESTGMRSRACTTSACTSTSQSTSTDRPIDETINLDEGSNDSATTVPASDLKLQHSGQSSLLENGFTRNVTESGGIGLQRVNQINLKDFHWQQKIDRFIKREDFEVPQPGPSVVAPYAGLASITVKIEDRSWRIPVQAEQIATLNIGWLAKEAAKRYYKKEGILPTIQLEVRGAILENDDPLSMVFISQTQAEELESTIVSWDLPSLPDRYIESCKTYNKEPNAELRELLELCQGTMSLQISDFHIDSTHYVPFLRALKRQSNLQHIDLSGTNLGDENLQELVQTLSTIAQLRSLNLSMNNITGEGLRVLSEMFTNSKKPILGQLADLNLSYNSLGNSCLYYLEPILRKVKLRSLSLVGCSLTSHSFETLSPCIGNLRLENLESLDLSYNELSAASIQLVLHSLNFTVLSKLNVSHNANVNDSGICREISNSLVLCDQSTLKWLGLARCKVTDAELHSLLSHLYNSNDLSHLDLSYNPDLSTRSLRAVLQSRPSFLQVRLDGCANITRELDHHFNISTDDEEHDSTRVRDLQISIDFEKDLEHINRLVRIWQNEWGDKARIEKMFNNYVRFSVAN